jgi:hypothetical protein
MLKEAIEKIVTLAENKTYEINGETYTEKPLTRIPPHVDRPNSIDISGLDSACKLINAEIARLETRLFVRINDYNNVDVFTTYEADYSRNYLYKVRCDLPRPSLGWNEYEQAMIVLRSQFIPNEGVDYLLSLLSKITNEESVNTSDNGLTQTVEAKQGVSLCAKVTVNPRVTLQPYRTFLEIEQPASEFLVRLDKVGNIGLFEADGGMWKMEAKASIKVYFEAKLAALVSEGAVIVMM